MKTVQDLIDELNMYAPNSIIHIYAPIRIAKPPFVDHWDYIGTIPSNIGYSSIEDYNE